MAMVGERQPLISSREIVAAALKGEDEEEDQDMLEEDSGEMQQFRAEAAVLQALPLPLQLIALATRYLAAAHALSPEIAERPTTTTDAAAAASAVKLGEGDEAADSDSARSHADYISAYRRYISASLTCCRAVVDGGKDPATRTQDHDVRYELRARAMLTELLVRETNDVAEAELHITKGVSGRACIRHLTRRVC
jgi:hypothetical protein